MAKVDTSIIAGSFNDELSSRYLTYALSTIMGRALPDVRDGLKPVHRRLLYAMNLLRLDPDKGFKKCARIVGEVMGKYHPHGDAAIYDALVRLAQEFAVRYPLVDGQGNFGSVDGDSAAAMRYTEARMTPVAKALLAQINEGTIDFRPTYDDLDEEPIVLPAAFPNLLANGSSGIAVGLATSIPPHNLREICSVLTALLKNPNTRDETLLNHIPAPDFPTGGVIVGDSTEMAAAYATGKGSIRIRCKWDVEDLGRGTWQIVITELPYQVIKSKVVEKIADLMAEKKLPFLDDIRDESAEDIRLVLMPKSKNIDAKGVMASLFKLTELESRFSLNMNVITAQGVPQLMSLKQVLQAFIDHRREVLVRRSNWRLGKIADRLHLLEAYMVVYLNIDEVIQIIKENDEPAPILCERFKIDDVQAQAILNMRLRSLRKLEEMAIVTEKNELLAEQAALEALSTSEEKQTDFLLEEVKTIKAAYGDARRTQIGGVVVDEETVALSDMVEKEPVTVLLSEQGWIRAMKGHMAAEDEAKFKDGDNEAARVLCQTTDSVTFFMSSGKVYQLDAHKLPGGRGNGEPLNLHIDIAKDDEVVSVQMLTAKTYLLASKQGQGFLVKASDLVSQTRTGKQIMNTGDKDALAFVASADVGKMVAVSSDDKLLVFGIDELPTLAKGKGVRLQQLKGEDLQNAVVFNAVDGFELVTKTGKNSKIFKADLWLGKRAQVGRNFPAGFKTGATIQAAPAGSQPVTEQPEPEDTTRIDQLLAKMSEKSEISKLSREDQLALLLGDDDDSDA